MGPHRPEMLILLFSQQKGCQSIYCKTGYYENKLLDEMAINWGKHLEMDISFEDIKTSIWHIKMLQGICTYTISNLNFATQE